MGGSQAQRGPSRLVTHTPAKIKPSRLSPRAEGQGSAKMGGKTRQPLPLPVRLGLGHPESCSEPGTKLASLFHSGTSCHNKLRRKSEAPVSEGDSHKKSRRFYKGRGRGSTGLAGAGLVREGHKAVFGTTMASGGLPRRRARKDPPQGLLSEALSSTGSSSSINAPNQQVQVFATSGQMLALPTGLLLSCMDPSADRHSLSAPPVPAKRSPQTRERLSWETNSVHSLLYSFNKCLLR